MKTTQPKPTQRTAVILSETYLTTDGRANMFAKAFRESGYWVLGAGYSPSQFSRMPTINQFDVVLQSPNPLTTFTRRMQVRAVMVLALFFWRFRSIRRALMTWQFPVLSKVEAELESNKHSQVTVLAQYWTAFLPAAYLAEKFGAKLIYDANELSFAERDASLLWRITHRWLVTQTERNALETADLTTTVGTAYSDAIADFYKMRQNPLVVRSLPMCSPCAPSIPEGKMRFIYSGHSHTSRHLDQLIESVSDWNSDRSLVMQLVGDSSEIRKLKDLVIALGLEQRVTFIEPVDQNELVEDLSRWDVGLAIFPNNSLQFKLCEPNKFYQYLYAGLPLIVTERSDMGERVTNRHIGWTCADTSPRAIAKTVNRITIEDVKKTHSGIRSAQQEFNFHKELEKFKAAVTALG